MNVPVDETEVLEDEAVGCSELERWCIAALALVALVIPVFDGGVGISDVRRVRADEVRVELVLDIEEEPELTDFSAVADLVLVSFGAEKEDVLRSGFDGVGGAVGGVSDGASDVSSSCTGSSGFWVFSSS